MAAASLNSPIYAISLCRGELDDIHLQAPLKMVVDTLCATIMLSSAKTGDPVPSGRNHTGARALERRLIPVSRRRRVGVAEGIAILRSAFRCRLAKAASVGAWRIQDAATRAAACLRHAKTFGFFGERFAISSRNAY